MLYIEVLKNIYSIIQSALFSYINLIKHLEKYGIKFNLYKPCVDNKIIEGYLLRLVFHVDDVKSSHKDKNMVIFFKQWIDFMYV